MSEADNIPSKGIPYDETLPKSLRGRVKTVDGKYTSEMLEIIFGGGFDSARKNFNTFDDTERRLVKETVIGKELVKSSYLFPRASLRKIALLLAADGVINPDVIKVLSYLYPQHMEEIANLSALLSPEEFSVKRGLPQDLRSGDVRKALVKLYGFPWQKICYHRRSGKATKKLPCLPRTIIQNIEFRQAINDEVKQRGGSLRERTENEIFITSAEREQLMLILEKVPLPEDEYSSTTPPADTGDADHDFALQKQVKEIREDILEYAERKRQRKS